MVIRWHISRMKGRRLPGKGPRGKIAGKGEGKRDKWDSRRAMRGTGEFERSMIQETASAGNALVPEREVIWLRGYGTSKAGDKGRRLLPIRYKKRHRWGILGGRGT